MCFAYCFLEEKQQQTIVNNDTAQCLTLSARLLATTPFKCSLVPNPVGGESSRSTSLPPTLRGTFQNCQTGLKVSFKEPVGF